MTDDFHLEPLPAEPLTEEEINTLPVDEVVERTLRSELDPRDYDSILRYEGAGYRKALADDLIEYRRLVALEAELGLEPGTLPEGFGL